MRSSAADALLKHDPVSSWHEVFGSKHVDVLFAFMPFGNPTLPSLGLSLLKATLRDQDRDGRIAYYNLAFCKAIGEKRYSWLSRMAPQSLLLGEWVFSQLAFGHCDSKTHNESLRKLLAIAAIEDSSNRAQVTSRPHARYRRSSFHLPWFFNELVMRMRMLPDFDLSPQHLSEFLMEVKEQAKPFVDSCVDHIVSVNPRILGFSMMFCQVCSSLAVARKVKEKLGASAPKVVFGGSDCEGTMGYTLLKAFPWIDYVCCGEGDKAFIELASRLLDEKENPRIQGIVGRDKGIPDEFSTPRPIMNLNELPFPDFEDYFTSLGALNLNAILSPMLPIEASRGCWWGERSHCTFCGMPGHTLIYRSKTPERLLREFDYLAGKHGPLAFHAVDNILDLSFFKSVFPEIIRKGLKLDVFFETKSNLRREEIWLLRDSGVLHIQAGIESLSDDTLRLMRKGVTGLQNVLLLKCCREIDMSVKWVWLWGFSNEKPSEYERMRHWIPLLHHLEPPGSFAWIHLDRFSPLFENQKEFGICNVKASFPYRLIYPLEEKALYDLAYYFDYDYEDGRNPEEYTAGLADEILKWRDIWNARSGHPILGMHDLQGRIFIRDTRPCAIEPVILLTGLEADIYRYLASIRERNLLTRHFVELGFEESDVLQAVTALMEKKIVLVDSDRCLALAVDVNASAKVA